MGEKKETRKELTTSYDRIIKAGLQPYYGDVAAWLLGTRPVEVRTVDTSLVSPVERLADRILEVRFRRRRAMLLHIEFQLRGGGDMPKRMAQYAALILDLLDAPEHRGKEFSSAVVYLDRKTYREDPGYIDRALSPGVRFTFSYRVVKLWEVDPGPILRLQAPGLWPFVPLMRGKIREHHPSGSKESLPGREVERRLRILGCQELPRRGGGSHRKWFNPGTGRATVLPDWGSKDLKMGTLRAAIRQPGIDWSRFEQS